MPVHRALIGLVAVACVAEPVVEPPEELDEDLLADGPELYDVHCAECHGPDGLGTAEGPDLTVRLADLTPAETATVIVYGFDDMAPVRELSEDEAFVVALWVHDAFAP